MAIRGRGTITWVGEERVKMEGEKGGCHGRERGSPGHLREPIKICESPDSGQ